MKKKILKIGNPLILVECFLVFLLAGPVWSSEIGMSATVDKTQATLEDTILLSVKIHGVQNAPQPQLPPLPEFRVQSAGTSSSMQIVNGHMNVSVTHNFRLTPKAAGSFTIGPAELALGGDVYTTDPISLVIKNVSSARPDQDATAFAEIRVSKLNPYVNEQVVLTFKLYRRVDAQNINLNISHDQFRKEGLGKAREYDQVVNGLRYRIYELSMALFAPRPGPVEIPPAAVEIDLLYRQKRTRGPFDSFFNDPFFGGRTTVQHKTLLSAPITMEVLALPEEGRPENFSGLVGQYEFKAALGKHSLEVGDTTTLTLNVAGSGNIQDVQLNLPQIQDTFKVYPDQPQVEKSVAGNKISGKKTFKFALVPMQEGELKIPSMSLIYFDPQARRYVSLASQALMLQATPAKDAEHLNVVDSSHPRGTPEDIQILGRDILPIHTVLKDFRDQGPNGISRTLSRLVLPILLFLGFVFYDNHQRRLRDDVAFSRTRRAYKQAYQKLNQLSARGDPKDLASQLSQILREYIGDKLNLQGTAFTATEVEEKLKEKQYPEVKILSTRKLLEKFEAYQYAGNQNTQSNQLLDESREVLKQLENQL